MVFGLEDDGTPSEHNCAPLLELDSAKLADQVRRYTGSDFAAMSIVEVNRNGQKFPAIVIGSVQVPLVFTRVGTYALDDQTQKTAFSKGTVYFRHGSKSEPGNSADLYQFLQRELERVRETWLGNIRKVVEAPEGASIVVTKSSGGSTPIGFTSDPTAPKMYLPKLSDGFPYKQNQALREINRRLEDQLPKAVNSHDIQTIKHVEEIDEKSRPEFVSVPHEISTPQYSQEFVDFVVGAYLDNSNYFSDCREKWKVDHYS